MGDNEGRTYDVPDLEISPVELEAPKATVSPQVEPVQPEERIAVVDVLRGFALLGILVVNIQFYTTPTDKLVYNIVYWQEPLHVWADRIVSWFFEMKFYTLFSFLFGFGMAIQMLRAEAKGRPWLGLHYRRMIVLLLIGLFHAFFIWMGDILVTYAILGCLLPLFSRLSPRWLLVAAACLLGLLVMLYAGGALLLGLASVLVPADVGGPWGTEGALQQVLQQAREQTRIYREGTYWEITALRAREVLGVYVMVLFFQGPHVFAMFLLGLYVGRTGWFQRLPETLPWFQRAWLVGLLLGVGGTIVTAILQHQANFQSFSGLAWKFAGVSLAFVTAPALSCFYATSLVLLHQLSKLRPYLDLLAPVGRMALTNYLAQSLICSTLFYGSTIFGFGFGLYARVGPAYGILLALAIWLVQVVWSNAWFRNLGLKFGPMEWLWRTLTYGHWQPMR
ncbi:MAG: DUF418 domain-containing protein [Gemmatales bacterium]|nr:DUF418 domain-containing protein [Gemmatales bacterium]MDW8387404.1 DUF418 domain-containing protein [Gemmatales bacterium]